MKANSIIAQVHVIYITLRTGGFIRANSLAIRCIMHSQGRGRSHAGSSFGQVRR